MADGQMIEEHQTPETGSPLDRLHRFARQAQVATQEQSSRAVSNKEPDEESCDLCGEAIGSEHRHLLNLSTRQVLCGCRACTLLFDFSSSALVVHNTLCLIPTRVMQLMDFAMTGLQWEAMQIPVNTAFFCYRAEIQSDSESNRQRIVALYPSPMGSTEASPPTAAWGALVEANPILLSMQPDVEALLIHRARAPHNGTGQVETNDVFLVPIDVCYRLVGTIRRYWKGMNGGSEVRQEMDRFFRQLATQADAIGGQHARP